MIPARIYLIGAGVAIAVAAVAYIRYDARQDYKRELEAARTQHLEDARSIENETRSDTDADLTDCLLGRRC